jgi:hypothetical protein
LFIFSAGDFSADVALPVSVLGETGEQNESFSARAMNRLTIQQAEVEARWRWGNLLVRGFARFDESLKRPFQVGTILFGKITIRGQGASWEGAFSDAAKQTNTESVATAPTASAPVRPPRPTAGPVAGRIKSTQTTQTRQRA